MAYQLGAGLAVAAVTLAGLAAIVCVWRRRAPFNRARSASRFRQVERGVVSGEAAGAEMFTTQFEGMATAPLNRSIPGTPDGAGPSGGPSFRNPNAANPFLGGGPEGLRV